MNRISGASSFAPQESCGQDAEALAAVLAQLPQGSTTAARAGDITSTSRSPSEWCWLAPYLVVVALLLTVANVVGGTHGMDVWTILIPYANRILAVAPAVIIGLLTSVTIYFMARGEKSPLKAMTDAVRLRFENLPMVAAVAVAVIAVPYAMGSYGLLKMAIHLVVPFYLDNTLATADRVLFLGHDPWRLTHALFGDPLSTAMIDRIYVLWVPLVMVGVLLASVAKPRLRAHFFLSFVLCWALVGVAGAYALSSAGPCFADRLGTESAPWFAPLMVQLSTAHATHGVNAVFWQTVLWNSAVFGDYEFARGISAAPSMHNAVCMLYVLALRNSSAVWRVGAKLFAAIVWIGSVHLGWHYAVDGLIAWAMMVGIWAGVGAYLDRVGYRPGRSRGTPISSAASA